MYTDFFDIFTRYRWQTKCGSFIMAASHSWPLNVCIRTKNGMWLCYIEDICVCLCATIWKYVCCMDLGGRVVSCSFPVYKHWGSIPTVAVSRMAWSLLIRAFRHAAGFGNPHQPKNQLSLWNDRMARKDKNIYNFTFWLFWLRCFRIPLQVRGILCCTLQYLFKSIKWYMYYFSVSFNHKL